MKSSVRTFLCFALISGAPASACELTKVTEMPLIALGSHYAVNVRINAEVRPMIVDTGAGLTAINLSAVKDLELKQDEWPGNEHRVLGAGQTTAESLRNVVPSVLKFGDLVYHDRSTAVMKSDFGDKPEGESVGFLGDDILSQFDVEFDFPAKKLTFYQTSECYDSFIPWTGTYSTIPFLHNDTKILIDIGLNDERDQALVDTGNPMSFVTRKLLKRWGVAPEQLGKTNAKIGTPLNGGKSFSVDIFAFDVVKIGDETRPLIKMSIVDMDGLPAPINLGLDFWRTRKVWISYPNKWMFVAQNGATKLAYPVKAPNRRDVANVKSTSEQAMPR